METTIQILIYVHAACGAIALLGGFVSLLAKKGGYAHKKFGLIFYYAMLLSGIIAMLVALLPNHQSPFLFAIGIFSLYFVLTGHRALRFKTKTTNFKIDNFISIVMIITGILMIILPILLTRRINIILVVFAIIGITFSIRDIISFKNPGHLKHKWLKLHLGKMIGGYVSATTAFVVVNNFFPSYYGWFIPGSIGGFIIAFWIRKINTKSPLTTNNH